MENNILIKTKKSNKSILGKLLYLLFIWVACFGQSLVFGQPSDSGAPACQLFEDFETRGNISHNCFNKIIKSGVAQVGNNSTMLGISHGTPKVVTGCTSAYDPDPFSRGLNLAAAGTNGCGDGVWFETELTPEKNYLLTFDVVPKPGIAPNTDGVIVLNIAAAVGLQDLNNNNTCNSLCQGSLQNGIFMEHAGQVNVSELPSLGGHCTSVRLHFQPAQYFTQLLFYSEVLNSNTFLGNLMLDNICLVEWSSPQVGGETPTEQIRVAIKENNNSLLIPQKRMPSNGQPEVNVYPNPSNGKFYVEVPSGLLSLGQGLELCLRDLNGQLIYKQEIAGSTELINLNKQINNGAGAYILTVADGGKILLNEMVIIGQN